MGHPQPHRLDRQRPVPPGRGLGHGADPTSADFGAEEISSAGSDGHTGYFATGTASLHNFAAIALGSYQSVSYRTN